MPGRVCGLAGGWLRGAGLDVAHGDEAGDQSEESSERFFGEVALQTGAEVTAGESARAEERSERPVRRDRAATGCLQNLVGDDPTDRSGSQASSEIQLGCSIWFRM